MLKKVCPKNSCQFDIFDLDAVLQQKDLPDDLVLVSTLDLADDIKHCVFMWISVGSRAGEYVTIINSSKAKFAIAEFAFSQFNVVINMRCSNGHFYFSCDSSSVPRPNLVLQT